MNLQEINDKIEAQPGFFSMKEMWIWDWILQYQNEENILGNLVEIGVLKGKSLSKLAQHHKKHERVLGIDFSMSQDGNKAQILNAIKKVSVMPLNLVELVECDTLYYNFDAPTNGMYFKENVRFMHIDGGHDGYTVYNDLKIADKMLSKDGILCIDDWRTFFYPDIQDAFYRYITEHPYSFKIVMITDTKMYACRPSNHQDYLWKFETKLWPFVKNNYKQQELVCLRTKHFIDSGKLLLFPKDILTACFDNSGNCFDEIK